MGNQEIHRTLDNKKYHIYFFGVQAGHNQTPLLIMPAAWDMSDLTEEQHMKLDPLIGIGEIPSFVQVVMEVDNWENDLSPWPAPAIGRGQSDFKGNALQTLEWLQDRLIPDIVDQIPFVKDGKKGLLGYSMAGLFAVWAATQTDCFSVYGSCSGSLWYQGFCDYLEQHPLKSPCSVYLSLGDQEEFTRNKWFRQVGGATRKTAEIIKASPMCRESALVWNPGKHTGAVGERLAAAQAWMLKAIAEPF